MSSTEHQQPPLPKWSTGDRMVKARDYARMTQQEMADALHIGRRSIVRYERSAEPPRPVVLSYSNITGIPVWWFDGYDSDPTPDQGMRASRCTHAPLMAA